MISEKELTATDDFASWERTHAPLLRRLALIVLIFGLLYRVFRYLLALPFYGDETMLMVNYLTHGYRDIFGPIDNCQIAPLLFHWAEIAAFQNLGSSEWSMRLPPLIAGIIGMLLFWRLAREVLSPVGHAIAVWVLAVSSFPVYTASIVKPYSCDLLASVALLLFFAIWLNRRDKSWPLWCLAVCGPLMALVSYPVVFIAGSIGPILLLLAWQSKRAKIAAPVLAFNLLSVGAFFAHYWFVGRLHLDSPINGTTTQAGMDIFWRNANCFPPAHPLDFLVWCFSVFAGELTAHPIGSQRGGSIVTLLIALVGVRVLRRERRWELLAAFAGVFVLWFIAAALRKYPMGSGRLSQHSAPIVCLLIGLGACTLIHRFAIVEKRSQLMKQLTGAFVVLAVGGMAWSVIRPYYDQEARWSRQATKEVVDASGGDLLLLAHPPEWMLTTLRWDLLPQAGRTVWAQGEDWPNAIGARQSIWVVFFIPEAPGEEAAWQERLSQNGAHWACDKRLKSSLPPEKDGRAYHVGRAYHFVRDNAQANCDR